MDDKTRESLRAFQRHQLGYQLLFARDSDPSRPESEVPRTDEQYDERNTAVFQAIATARVVGYDAGVAPDPKDPTRMVAYIELPDGQVSWHLPVHGHAWDGHTTETKYDRCMAYYARESE